MSNTDAVARFISEVRQHFSTPKRNEAEEKLWLKSLANVLRDYVPSELEHAAKAIIDTRELRYFPLPSECLKACAHARTVIRARSTVALLNTPEKPTTTECGRERRRREDRAWAAKMRAKGVKLRSDIEGYDPADWNRR